MDNITRRLTTSALGAVLVTGGLIVGGSGVLTASSATETAAAGCATGALPPIVLGAPTLKAGDAKGVYLWHDGGRYKLRVTHPGHAKVVFTGTITATRDITGVNTVKLENGDNVRLSKNKRTLTFRFTNVGALDGLGFSAGCAKGVHLNLRINGHEAGTGAVFLGAGEGHPTSVPFTLERARTSV